MIPASTTNSQPCLLKLRESIREQELKTADSPIRKQATISRQPQPLPRAPSSPLPAGLRIVSPEDSLQVRFCYHCAYLPHLRLLLDAVSVSVLIESLTFSRGSLSGGWLITYKLLCSTTYLPPKPGTRDLTLLSNLYDRPTAVLQLLCACIVLALCLH